MSGTQFVPAQLLTAAQLNAAIAAGGIVQSVNSKQGNVILDVSHIGGAAPLDSPAFAGNPRAPTAPMDEASETIANTLWVMTQAGDAPPAINGVAGAGTSKRWSRQDHVHPQDTTRVAKTGDVMTGFLTLSADPTAPLHAATRQYVLAQIAAGVVEAPNDGALYGRQALAWQKGVKLAGDTMTGALRLAAGTLALPPLSFTSDATSGLYASAAATMQMVISGVARLTMDATDIVTTLPIRGQNGTAAAPALSFSGDNNTGLYWISADTMGLTAGGTLRVTFSTTGITSTVPIVLPASDPTLSEHATRKAYVDTQVGLRVLKAGDTMTGPLVLPADATLALQAATKQQVDAGDALKVNKAGDTMTGPLVLPADATLALQAVTKQQMDAADAALTTSISTKVAKAGDIMTGALEVPTGTGATPGLRVGTGSISGIGRNAADNALDFITNSVVRMTVGTASLAITGMNVVATNTASIAGFTASTVNGNAFVATVSGAGAGLDITASGSGGKGIIVTVSHASAGDAFTVEDSTRPDSTPFIIKNDGKVGIGLSAPTVALDVVGNVIGSLAPSAIGHLTRKDYVDAADTVLTTAVNGKVAKAGDTMTGPLVLNADPAVALEAATKQYVDTKMTQAAADVRYLQLAGGTLTGALVLAADPSQAMHAATKQYVDTHLTQAEADAIYLNTNGDTMTGLLILSADPAAALGAATKQYVDATDVLKVAKAGDTMTGPLVLPADPTLALQAATKQYVDTQRDTRVAKAGDTMTGALALPDGTVGLPALTFSADTNTGIYRGGADNIVLVCNGGWRVSVTATSFSTFSPISAPVGSVGVPSYTFTGDSNTGFYWIGADQIGVSTNGVLRLTVGTTAITSALPIVLPANPTANLEAATKQYVDSVAGGVAGGAYTKAEADTKFVDALGDSMLGVLALTDGTALLPGLAFSGDPDTGLHRIGANQLGLVAGGAVRLTLTATETTSAGAVRTGIDGTAAAPAYTFVNDPNTGVYSAGADAIGLSTNGVLRLSVSTTAITAALPITLPADATLALQAVTKQQMDAADALKVSKAGDTMTGALQVPVGTAAAPSLRAGDTDTGIWGAADTINFSTGGTNRLALTTALLSSTLPANLPAGTASTPALQMGDTNSGLVGGEDVVAVSVNGAIRLTVNETSIVAAVPVVLPGAPTADAHATTKLYVDGLIAAAGGRAETADTPPLVPQDGGFWFDSSSLTLFIYYDDGTSQQWVQAIPTGSSLTAADGDARYIKKEDTRKETSIVDNTGTNKAPVLTGMIAPVNANSDYFQIQPYRLTTPVGDNNTDGAAISLRGPTFPPAPNAVQIYAGNNSLGFKEWKFAPDGNLSMPGYVNFTAPFGVLWPNGGAVYKDTTGHFFLQATANDRLYRDATDGAWRFQASPAYSTTNMQIGADGWLTVRSGLTIGNNLNMPNNSVIYFGNGTGSGYIHHAGASGAFTMMFREADAYMAWQTSGTLAWIQAGATAMTLDWSGSLWAKGNISAAGSITSSSYVAGAYLAGGAGWAGTLRCWNSGNNVNFRWNTSAAVSIACARIDEAVEIYIPHAPNCQNLNLAAGYGTGTGIGLQMQDNGGNSGVCILDGWSDRRIKENIKDTELDGLAVLRSLRVRQFDIKAEVAKILATTGMSKEQADQIEAKSTHVPVGFVTQEVIEAGIPEAVHIESRPAPEGSPLPPDMQSLAPQLLVPYLWRQNQQLLDLVEKLEARVAALEGGA